MASSAKVTLTVDPAWVRNSIANGELFRAFNKGAGRGRDYIKREITASGRVDTGRMRNATIVKQEGGAVPKWWIIAAVNYSAYQNDGTRDHGTRRAKFMVFTPPGAGGPVFAKRVRGVKPANFMEKGLARLTSSDFTT